MNIDNAVSPRGEIMLQTVAMPKDTNASGDIFGGWLMSQMDLATGVQAHKKVGGRVVTVAVEAMTFICPVYVGAIVTCYTSILKIGNTSIKVLCEVWIPNKNTGEPSKVTEGTYVFVALDENGNKRNIKS